ATAGGAGLTVNGSKTLTFSAAVGTVALSTLATDVGGMTVISGGAVTTTAAQTYGDDVTLGAAATLSAGGTSNSAAIDNGGFLLTLTLAPSGTWDAAGAIT